jgi:hypothetical protein
MEGTMIVDRYAPRGGPRPGVARLERGSRGAESRLLVGGTVARRTAATQVNTSSEGFVPIYLPMNCHRFLLGVYAKSTITNRGVV